MKKEHSKLVEKVIGNLDWDCIFESYRAFKMGVGEGNIVIPGIKRKQFSDSLTKNDIKNELKVLLKHAINGDVTEIYYGPWIISWINGDWSINDLEIEFDTDSDEDAGIYETEQDESMVQDEIIVSSRLEVIYAPQRISLSIGTIKEGLAGEEESDLLKIEMMMQKAIQNEDYELASKFRDILKYQNKDQESDT
jgi:hypothetical protein